MGLETVHPQILERLNKRMTLDQFAKAAVFCAAMTSICASSSSSSRLFMLAKEESLEWAARSLDFAMEQGATAATLIPTRGGNGAMEDLAARGQFEPPALQTLEAAMEYGLRLKAGRVFADLGNLREPCANCHPQRLARLRQMNLRKSVLDRIPCAQCGGAS